MTGTGDPVDSVRQLSLAMRDAAARGDWDEVARLEAKRRPQLPAAVENVSVARAAEVAALIAEILALDREVVEFGEQGRVALQQGLADLQTGQRALKAYQQAGE